jgi:hypothetical protein
MNDAGRRYPAILRVDIRMLAALMALSVVLRGCRPTSHPQTTLDDLAHQYVLLALGLGERDPDSLDFAVVPPELRAQVHAGYPTLETIEQRARSLRLQVQALEPQEPQDEARDRADFLSLQLAALAARAAMLRGHLLPFDQEAGALFDVRVIPDHSSMNRRAIREQVAAMLPPSSDASPAARYAAYQQRFLVPPDRLKAVMQASLAACRQQTVAHLTLPAGESVELQFVRNQPWSAFSRYLGNRHSVIQLNLDLPVTVDEALELACHEGYPGHHVFNTLRDAALSQGKGWPEAQVQPTFSPQSYVSEAAAAFAPRLAFPLPERIRVERDVLFPLAGLPGAEAARYVGLCDRARGLSSAEPAIAREFLDGSLDFVRAEESLQREVLISRAEPLLLYLNEYRSYMLAYTDGPARFALLVGLPDSLANADNPEARERTWKRYQDLMQHMVYRLPDPPERGL